MNIQRMKLSEEGLGRFFGPLEAQIMEIIWRLDVATIKKVQSLLPEDLSFNTVMTVLNRLYEKGHLLKQTAGHGRNKMTTYRPVASRQHFIQEQTRILTAGLVHEYGQLVVNQLFDVVQQADPQLLSLLEERLVEWKRGQA